MFLLAPTMWEPAPGMSGAHGQVPLLGIHGVPSHCTYLKGVAEWGMFMCACVCVRAGGGERGEGGEGGVTITWALPGG